MYQAYQFRNNHNTKHPFKQPSRWQPPISDNPNLLQYICNVWYSLKSNFIPHPLTSLSLKPPQRAAIRSLKQLPDTIIKPMDKRGAIVLWPTSQYLTEAHRQLHNTDHYIKVNHNPIPPLVHSITQFLNYMMDNLHIDHTTHKFLLSHSPPRNPYFTFYNTIQ